MKRVGWVLALASVLAVGCRSNSRAPAGGATESPRILNAFPRVTSSIHDTSGPDWRDVKASRGVSASALGGGDALSGSATTLVLYDDGGPWGWLGELYAMAAGNLTTRFGSWSAKPIGSYQAGDMAAVTAVIYVGSTYDQPIPAAFLEDVLSRPTPVIWIYQNIWQLVNHAPDRFASRYGFTPATFDTVGVTEVRYKGTSLTRSALNLEGVMTYSVVDPARATVLAEAVRSDGSRFPWAIRSANVTYVGEIPFAFINETDRYLAYCDLLFDVLAPSTPERHRALLRLEDVSAKSDPVKLKAIADFLWKQRIPYSVAVIPVYLDPLGVYSADGRPETVRLRDAPALVDALKYMAARGGVLLMHGYTHQYEAVVNPYSGASADDFEFWMAHIDELNYVRLDTPVPDDSAERTSGRVAAAFAEFEAAGLPAPTIFEYPHYAGSALDSRTLRARFSTAYHRGLYFSGALSGAEDTSRWIGQFFPYAVRDLYGWKLLPENIGNFEPLPENNNPPRFPADLLRNVLAAKVVRDGFASQYFHPYYELSVLKTIVKDTMDAGYRFVSPLSVQ